MLKLILLLFIALIIVAVRFLPWWSLLVLAVLAIVVFKYFVRWVFLAPFKTKGAVLHGATLQVHSVERMLRPPSRPAAEYEHEPVATHESGSEESGGNDPGGGEPHSEAREFYFVDMTLAPRDGSGDSVSLWEPGEMLLSTPGKNPMSDSDSNDVGELERVEVFEEGVFGPDEEHKYTGTQRLRLLLAVDPAIHEVQLNYYFESLGTIELKPPLSAQSS